MQTRLLAYTITVPDNLKAIGYEPHDFLTGVSQADELAEVAGRLCFKSWSRPNPATATNEGYLANIIKQGHFSVLEHASFTVHLRGVSRSLTHELVRHRHLSYSQESQRYVDVSSFEVIFPPALDEDERSFLVSVAQHARDAYAELVDRLVARGLERKQARQAARSVLPNATGTEIIVTGNIRAWRHVIQMRGSAQADAEIRILARHILQIARALAPNSVQDLEDVEED
jgi:thymidylate synthase (FAD)